MLDRSAIEYPLELEPTAQLFREEWVVNTVDYAPPARDTPHPESAEFDGFILVDVQGIRKTPEHTFYELTWATVPADHDEPLSYAFTFPGYDTERDPPTLGMTARVEVEYFVTDDPVAEISTVPRQRFENTYGEVAYLNDGGGVLVPTTPTRADYKAMVTAEDEFVAEDSALEHYYGNIWARRTINIIAQ